MCRFGIMIRVYSKARIQSPSLRIGNGTKKYVAFRFGELYIPIYPNHPLIQGDRIPRVFRLPKLPDELPERSDRDPGPGRLREK